MLRIYIPLWCYSNGIVRPREETKTKKKSEQKRSEHAIATVYGISKWE